MLWLTLFDVADYRSIETVRRHIERANGPRHQLNRTRDAALAPDAGPDVHNRRPAAGPRGKNPHRQPRCSRPAGYRHRDPTYAGQPDRFGSGCQRPTAAGSGADAWPIGKSRWWRTRTRKRAWQAGGRSRVSPPAAAQRSSATRSSHCPALRPRPIGGDIADLMAVFQLCWRNGILSPRCWWDTRGGSTRARLV